VGTRDFLTAATPAPRRSEEFVTPPAVQAAIDAGDSAEVTKLLTPLPEGMSKALFKKLVKLADINAKKLSQGKSTAPAAAAKPAAPKAAAAASAAPAGAAAAPMGAASQTMGGGAGIHGDALVTDMLARIESLGFPAEVLATLQQQREAISEAMAPRLNAMRNTAYAQGFTARA